MCVYSTTGALEGALFVKQKQLFNLSQQNLLDCSYVRQQWVRSTTLLATELTTE